jgi:hypothetical protein
LPWPNNTFTVLDPSSPTGLRVSVQRKRLPNPDSPEPLNRLDGFSVISGLAVGFEGPISVRTDARPATAMRLFRATPGKGAGEELPLRLTVTAEPGASLLIGYPLRPMAYETDYVAVVTDELEGAQPSRRARVSLGLERPASPAEEIVQAHFVPVKALLGRVGIPPERVLRVWEFTTRSAQGVRAPFEAMRRAGLEAAAGQALSVQVALAKKTVTGALEVRGTVSGLPTFTRSTGELALDELGVPQAQGPHSVPFRVVLPRATTPYPLVVFGHGTGGTAGDDTFDAEIVAAGAAKLNLEFAGWTESTVLQTLVGLDRRFSGSERSTGRLLQSLADASALEASLDGVLGQVLSQPTLGDEPNPASGLRSAPELRVYAGGSLGGTLGFVHLLTEPRLRAGVLNVPGAGWTHFVPTSAPFSDLDVAFATTTPSPVDRALSVVMSQSSWDPVDGAAWAPMKVRDDLVMLLQESMGDPVLPNIGTNLVATSSGAAHVGEVLEPVVGLELVDEARYRTALTQYRVPSTVTDLLGRHGFGGGDTLAGVAAREQISAFLESVWRGAPVIVLPPTCRRTGRPSCDFAAD